MKNVAGYDVSRVASRQPGHAGLDHRRLPQGLAHLPPQKPRWCSNWAKAALEQLHRWGGRPLPLNASCWVKDATQASAPELLFVRLRGAVAAVESACERMAKEAGGQHMDNAQAGPDWAACRDQRLPFFQSPAPELCLWRLSLPQTAPVISLVPN
ncbi:MAG: hypothetical protein R3E42_13860 [Burkholderiaceae bacterium]